MIIPKFFFANWTLLVCFLGAKLAPCFSEPFDKICIRTLCLPADARWHIDNALFIKGMMVVFHTFPVIPFKSLKSNIGILIDNNNAIPYLREMYLQLQITDINKINSKNTLKTLY